MPPFAIELLVATRGEVGLPFSCAEFGMGEVRVGGAAVPLGAAVNLESVGVRCGRSRRVISARSGEMNRPSDARSGTGGGLLLLVSATEVLMERTLPDLELGMMVMRWCPVVPHNVSRPNGRNVLARRGC